jgi:hypothetical protein
MSSVHNSRKVMWMYSRSPSSYNITITTTGVRHMSQTIVTLSGLFSRGCRWDGPTSFNTFDLTTQIKVYQI